MKKNEVPQDDANMTEGITKELQYALDEDGNYVEVKSVGWEPKNIVMQHAWDDVKEDIEMAVKQIKLGKKSPIYFFMYKFMMDEKILSEYTDFWVFTVKRHLKPKVFKKLSDDKLEIYKRVFKLKSIDELKKFDIDKELKKVELLKHNN